MIRVSGLLVAAGFLLAACDARVNEPDTALVTASAEPQVQAADFALIPCSDTASEPCVLVRAGGKRLLFGAPAGISARLEADDLAALDAAFLFSLHPADVEGLDEVRNRGWRAGRLEALPVSGPEGTDNLVEGLNLAFEQADALSFVEDGAPAGGFDAALLSLATLIEADSLVFDSGDLKVRAAAGPVSSVTYRIGYRDIDEVWHDLVLAPCNGVAVAEGSYPAEPENRQVIGCEGEAAGYAWPVPDLLFIVKSAG